MDIRGDYSKELLYSLINIGLDAMDKNKVRPFEDALADIEGKDNKDGSIKLNVEF